MREAAIFIILLAMVAGCRSTMIEVPVGQCVWNTVISIPSGKERREGTWVPSGGTTKIPKEMYPEYLASKRCDG